MCGEFTALSSWAEVVAFSRPLAEQGGGEGGDPGDSLEPVHAPGPACADAGLRHGDGAGERADRLDGAGRTGAKSAATAQALTA